MSEKDQNEQPKKRVTRRQFLTRTAAGAGAVALTSVLTACGGSSGSGGTTVTGISASNLSGSSWKFGVISDTQWTTPPGDDHNSPNSSAIGIINQVQQQFISNGVKFVVHVGDLCDNGSIAGEDTRALYAQPLYNAGIGFFPLRGNHDDGSGDNAEFQRLYPQTQNGVQNNSPADLRTFSTTDPQVTQDAAGQPVPSKTGSTFPVGSNFSSPDPWSNGSLKGLTYSFDFNNARLILLDQFTPIGGTGANPTYNMATTVSSQQSWITQQLQGRATGSHAFVFAHKGLLTCNHADGLFGNDPSQNPAAQNAFIGSMASNKAQYYVNGHDHIYDRSLIKSPDGSASVMQILCASDSSKFYVPAGSPPNNVSQTVSNDARYNGANSLRRAPITQELYTVGFYIFTVDGASVTVDYYAADVFPYLPAGQTGELIVPTAQGLNFTKRESFGYGLNGKQFVIRQGQPYTTVQDTSSSGTTAQILSGVNGSQAADANLTPCVKVVNTGWAAASNGSSGDVLTLWGIDTYAGSVQRDTYVLSMSVPATVGQVRQGVVLSSLDSNGKWTNAVDLNLGGTKNFINGPWNASYGLGTYGVDTANNRVWAVLNYNAVFAIAPGA